MFLLAGHAALKRKDLQTAQQKLSGAPKARQSRQSPPQDGFAGANLGATPQDYGNPKTSALKARFTSG
jgi:hypothetical protein